MSALSQGPFSLSTWVPNLRVSARRTAVHLRSGHPRQRRRVDHHQLISQVLFRYALLRELKRADRFEEAFVLVLISFNSRATHPSRWAEVVDALTGANREADVIGWFEQDSVIGLIRSTVHRDPKKAATALAATVQCELSRSLTSETAASCSIRLEVYSPHNEAIAPVFFNEKHRRQRARAVVRDAAKRVLDVAGSVTLLIVLSPAFLLISALVKLTSKGPIFLRQVRVGHAGRPFTMLKFRTMQVDADHLIHQQYVAQFIQSSAPAEPAKDSVFKIVNDPRVTRLGHFLRRSSLDELPQFWNVLKGEMSLVGPRPPLPYEVACYKRWHWRRLLEAKPGITGLWQVTGRSRTTFDDMVRLDLQYAKGHSLWTDLKILFATPRAVVTGNGAH